MRLKPWYDAYGGPYKDQYRFWTGLLVVVRCFLVLVVATNKDLESTAEYLMWVCLVFIPLVALLQIYKNAILNVLEIFYFSALLAMTFLATARIDLLLYLMVIIISLSSLIAILLLHIKWRLNPTHLGRFLQQIPKYSRKIHTSQSPSVGEASAIEKDDSNTSTHSRNVAKYYELRESLLDDVLTSI